MSEVQKHGFTWQNSILCGVYGATSEELASLGYTCIVDLPSHLNRLEKVDLSIKTTKTANSVCMGDCIRVFDECATPIHLVVLHYRQINPSTKRLIRTVEVDLTNSRALLFGSVTRAQIEALDEAVKAVPQKRKPTAEEYKKMYDLRDELQKLSGAIHLDIKCNSQQSRLQCSFNKFQEFLKANTGRIVAESTNASFRGGCIIEEITSSPRVFRPRTI
jgi:soluble cytochrome b562